VVVQTPLDVALAVWKEARCSVSMVVLDEIESLELDSSIALGAFVAYSQPEHDTEDTVRPYKV